LKKYIYIDFACTPTELEEQKKAARQVILSLLHQRILDEVADTTFYAKLKKRFELTFKFDEAHRPRIWRTLEEISPRYDDAKLKTRNLLQLFVSPDEHLDITVLDPEAAAWERLISEPKKLLLWERLEVEAGALFQEAANSTANSFAKIPPWFYAILLILGWNELWTIITNPLYLFVAVLLGGIGFAIISLNLQGPAIQMSKTVSTEAYKIAFAQLEQFVNRPETSSRTSSAAHAQQKDKFKTM